MEPAQHLKTSEVAHLKVDDIDSTRMMIRVEQGKGRKDRNAMLSPHLLDLLRQWWREGKRRGVMLPYSWLFPGRYGTDPISARQLPALCRKQPNAPRSISGQAHIRCGIRSPLTYSSRVSISASSRYCWDM